MKVLRNVATPVEIDVIKQALSDADVYVRRNAARALQGRAGGHSLDLIKQTLNHSNASVRRNAAVALQNHNLEMAEKIRILREHGFEDLAQRTSLEATDRCIETLVMSVR